QKFQISLFTHSDNNRGKNIGPIQKEWECAMALFELFILIGGLGRRSRRGFGSMQLINKKYGTTDDVKKDIERKKTTTIEAIKVMSNYNQPKAFSKNIAPWPIMTKDHMQIAVGQEIEWNYFISDLMGVIHDELKSGKLKSTVLGFAKG